MIAFAEKVVFVLVYWLVYPSYSLTKVVNEFCEIFERGRTRNRNQSIRGGGTVGMVWYGIVGFNVPLDTIDYND